MQKISLTLLVGFVVFVGYLTISKISGGDFTNSLEVAIGGDKMLHLVLAFILSVLSLLSFSHKFSGHSEKPVFLPNKKPSHSL